MTESYLLDLKFLKEQNISVIEYISLLHLFEIDVGLDVIDLNILHSLQEKQFIKLIEDKDGTMTILREKSKLLVEFLAIETSQFANKTKKSNKSETVIKDDLDDFVEEYRLLWKGLKSGSMGSSNACKEKLIRWMRSNPNYSKEDILKAARIYIKSLDNYKYLQAADYFIYKKEGKEEGSRLSAFIDEIEVDNNSDWTTTLR